MSTEAAVARVLRPKTAEGEWSRIVDRLWYDDDDDEGATAAVIGGVEGRPTPPQDEEDEA